MTIDEYVNSLMELPEYSVLGFAIGDISVELFVGEITIAQADIPKTIYGREVIISKVL